MTDIIDVLFRLFDVLLTLTSTLWTWLTSPVNILGLSFVPLWGIPAVIVVLLVAYIIKLVTPML